MSVPSERIQSRTWCVVSVVLVVAALEVLSLNGPNVCMVKQKYNITKRVKYRAPMSIRTYEWCFSMPPRCSKWNTEMRDLTRLETEERTAEVAVCCPGYKMRDVSCVPICPNGKTGSRCAEDCPPKKWGPNCVHDCVNCEHGHCSPITGECDCDDGWQGESCSVSMPSTPSTTTKMEEILTTAKSTTKTFLETTTKPEPTTRSTETTVPSTTPLKVVTFPTTTSTTTTRITSTLKATVDVEPSPTAIEVYNTTVSPVWTTSDMMKTPKNILLSSNYNRTEIPLETSSDVTSTKQMYATTKKQILTTLVHVTNTTSTALSSTTTTMSTTSLIKLTVKETSKTESSRKPETTAKVTTTKTKPKEIWIRPTQRGESTFIETKIKTNHDLSHSRHRGATKNEETPEMTTPRTIVVSIIPTSVSYVTFKKIALTTASYVSQKNNITLNQASNKTEQAVTKSLTTQQPSTTMSSTVTIFPILPTLLSNTSTTSTVSPPLIKNVTKTSSPKHEGTSLNKTKLLTSKATNSMPSTYTANKKVNSFNILTITSPSTNHRTQGLRTHGTTAKLSKPTSSNHQTTSGRSSSHETTVPPIITKFSRNASAPSTSIATKHPHTEKPRIVSAKPELVTPKVSDTPAKSTKLLAIKHFQKTNDTKRNITKVSNTKSNTMTTAGPPEDETFHILTEPEHITAVMSDKERDHSSVDLISVISIAGGVMMAVITVAVIIVMVERCRRPRYDDVRKINDIRMQVMIDNNDIPPPYVRSIFHTPLPDPPTSEKCHYQPISTLDRNLKQFMRPVVVQTISPIMLENFRGILECHYDHLPQRNYDSETISTRCSITPSMTCTEELRAQRALSVTDYTIETLKCEAKLDVIDNTTSEPLYAEIPCWRPPSEHAIEVLNLNGEAVTEL